MITSVWNHGYYPVFWSKPIHCLDQIAPEFDLFVQRHLKNMTPIFICASVDSLVCIITSMDSYEGTTAMVELYRHGRCGGEKAWD